MIGMAVLVLGSLFVSLFGSVWVASFIGCSPIQGFVVLVGLILLALDQSNSSVNNGGVRTQ